MSKFVLPTSISTHFRIATQTTTKMPSFTPTSTLSETSTDTPTQPAHNTGNVQITTIFYNSSGQNEPDEYVEIQNKETL